MNISLFEREKNLSSHNYIEANILWNLITIYKGLSDDKLLNFFKSMEFRGEDNNRRVVESINVIKVDGYMTFSIWFENEKEVSLYPFYYARVSSWFKSYINKNIIRIEWK